MFGTTTFADDKKATSSDWRALPLAVDGKVHKNWSHVGWGGFVYDNDPLRTECDERGMGLLVYTQEKFGNCQIRVVYKPKNSRSNSGVYVRIDDGILDRLKVPTPPVLRGADGTLSNEMLQKLTEMSNRDVGPWYAVHHGYEVQLCDDADPFHRTGAVYSLARAADLPKKGNSEWRTMIITLKSSTILIDVDGQHIATFDPAAKDVPPQTIWHEPRRETHRPQIGYIGLQNHDPGDVVHFKEISVRPLRR